MSRSVTVITARENYRYKMAYHGDKFLHIGAVTIVNNTEHTLHYAELQTYNYKLSYSTLQSVVEERGCYYFKGLIRIQKEKKCALYCMVSTFRPYLTLTDRKNVLRLGQNATDRNRT